jgi:DNA replication protein DnaC
MANVDRVTLEGQAHLLQVRKNLAVVPLRTSSAPVLPPIQCKHCGAVRARLPFCDHIAKPCLCADAEAEREAGRTAERLNSERIIAAQAREREDKQTALIRKLALEMPEKLRGCSFENFQVLPHTQQAFESAQRLVARNGSGSGLMLLGDVGVGKTHLAAAIANAEIAAGRSALCGTVPDLLSRISASWESDTETELQVMRPFFDCSLLVLDDLGTETIHPWVEERMYRIINHRYTYERRVVITTNVGLEAIQARYDKRGNLSGQRIVSRLFEMCKGVNVKGPDYRRRPRR